jgi:hypothetical protein
MLATAAAGVLKVEPALMLAGLVFAAVAAISTYLLVLSLLALLVQKYKF